MIRSWYNYPMTDLNSKILEEKRNKLNDIINNDSYIPVIWMDSHAALNNFHDMLMKIWAGRKHKILWFNQNPVYVFKLFDIELFFWCSTDWSPSDSYPVYDIFSVHLCVYRGNNDVLDGKSIQAWEGSCPMTSKEFRMDFAFADPEMFPEEDSLTDLDMVHLLEGVGVKL